MLPTTLGNHIAAWEHYPYRRYGIDAITLWPRLVPLLSKPVLNAMTSARATFDLQVNAIVLLPIWGLLRAIMLARPGERGERVAWLILSFSLTYLIWKFGLVPAAVAWGETVKAAFDLHRLDVLKQMGVVRRPALSAAEERSMWRELIWPMKFGHESLLTYSMRETSASDGKSDDGADGPAGDDASRQ